MIRGRPVLAGFLACAAITAAGCQNPFDPEADIRVIRWHANGNLVAQVTQNVALTTEMENQYLHMTVLYLGNFSPVGVRMTSYVVVYRQIGAQDPPVNLPAGSPIPSLGGAAGRRYPVNFHIPGVSSNENNVSDIYAVVPSPFEFEARLITRELLTYIGNNPGTLNGGIDCEVEVFGVDHNGHDVKVTTSLHVEVL